MVSPPDKNGGDVIANPQGTRAASAGNAVGFASLQAFGDVQGTGIATDYVARRNGRTGTRGWTVHAITPRQGALPFVGALTGQQTSYFGEFSDDLSVGLVRAYWPTTDSANVASVVNLYRRTDLLSPGPGTYELVTSAESPVANRIGDQSYTPVLAGSSSDLEQVLFESTKNLTADAPSQGAFCVALGLACAPRLYIADGTHVSFVGYVPAGSDERCGPSPLPSCVVAARSVAGGGAGSVGLGDYTPGAMAADGTRVFFTVPPSGGGAPGDLYVRFTHGTADSSDDTTAKVNVVEGGAGPSTNDVTYQGASADGRAVFFTTRAQLLPDDTNTVTDLYRYEVDAADGHHLTLISKDAEGSDGFGNTRGVMAMSDDGGVVYFLVIGNQLVAGAGAIDPQYDGLYEWRDGTMTFIGALDKSGTVGGRRHDDVTPNLATTGLINAYSARVTPDGTTLAFEADDGRYLTGYTSGTCPDVVTGLLTQPCSQVYVYQDGTGLRCASCGAPGSVPTTNASFTATNGLGGSPALPQHIGRPIAKDGSRVYFETGEALVASDVNGRILDVYEYDTTTGQRKLITTGRGTSDAYFLDASSDAGDVFFTTRDKLVGWDTDNNYDLYDARIGGGFPDPPAVVQGCTGDACQGPQSNAPVAASAGSISFVGPGNAKATVVRRLALVAKGVRARHLTLAVRVPGRGQLVVTGRGLRTVRKHVARARTVRLRLSLERKLVRAVQRRGRVHTIVRVRYVSADGSHSTARIRLAIARAAVSKRGRAARRAGKGR